MATYEDLHEFAPQFDTTHAVPMPVDTVKEEYDEKEEELELALMDIILGEMRMKQEAEDGTSVQKTQYATACVTVQIMACSAVKPFKVTVELPHGSVADVIPELDKRLAVAGIRSTYTINMNKKDVGPEALLIHTATIDPDSPDGPRLVTMHVLLHPMAGGNLVIDFATDPTLSALAAAIKTDIPSLSPMTVKKELAKKEGMRVFVHNSKYLRAASELPRGVPLHDPAAYVELGKDTRFKGTDVDELYMDCIVGPNSQRMSVFVPVPFFFYVKVPSGDDVVANPQLAPLQALTVGDMREVLKLWGRDVPDSDGAYGVTVVERKRSCGWQLHPEKYYKMVFQTKTLANRANRALVELEASVYMDKNSFIDDTTKALREIDCMQCSWVWIKGDLVTKTHSKRTSATFVVDDATVLQCEQPHPTSKPPVPPQMRVFCWDTEVNCGKSCRPFVKITDPYFQPNTVVMNSCSTYLSGGRLLTNVLITMLPCDAHPAFTVVRIRTPLQIVQLTRRVLHMSDAAIVTGFNTKDFDYKVFDAAVRLSEDARTRMDWFGMGDNKVSWELFKRVKYGLAKVRDKERRMRFVWKKDEVEERLSEIANIREPLSRDIVRTNLMKLPAVLGGTWPVYDGNGSIPSAREYMQQLMDCWQRNYKAVHPQLPVAIRRANAYVRGFQTTDGFDPELCMRRGDALFWDPYHTECHFTASIFSTQQSKDRHIFQLKFDIAHDLDMLYWCRLTWKGKPNNLNAVTARLRLPQKLDFTAAQMFELIDKVQEERNPATGGFITAATLIKCNDFSAYCVRDTEVTFGVLAAMKNVTKFALMSWLTCTSIGEVESRGVTRRFSNILFVMGWKRFVFYPRSDGWQEGVGYEGALVASIPVINNEHPQTCQDIVSLYPSGAQRGNTCSTTLIMDDADMEEARREGLDILTATGEDLMAPADVPLFPDFAAKKFHMVQHTVGDEARHPKGLVPEVMKLLVYTRRDVKAYMKTVTDPQELELLDLWQLVLKLLANGGYGALAFSGFKLPMIVVAAFITWVGRWTVTQMQEGANEMSCPSYLLRPDVITDITRRANNHATVKKSLLGTKAEDGMHPQALALLRENKGVDLDGGKKLRLFTYTEADIETALRVVLDDPAAKKWHNNAFNGGDTDSIFFRLLIDIGDRSPFFVCMWFGMTDHMAECIERDRLNPRYDKVDEWIVMNEGEYVGDGYCNFGPKMYSINKTEWSLGNMQRKDKGLPCVRGDVPLAIRKLYRTVLYLIPQNKLAEAQDIVKTFVQRLMDNTVPPKELCKAIYLRDVVSVENTNAEQFQVAGRMRRLDAAGVLAKHGISQPIVGMPLPLIKLMRCPDPMQDNGKKGATWEHPDVYKALYTHVPLDAAYYINLLAGKLFILCKFLNDLSPIYKEAADMYNTLQAMGEHGLDSVRKTSDLMGSKMALVTTTSYRDMRRSKEEIKLGKARATRSTEDIGMHVEQSVFANKKRTKTKRMKGSAKKKHRGGVEVNMDELLS